MRRSRFLGIAVTVTVVLSWAKVYSQCDATAPQYATIGSACLSGNMTTSSEWSSSGSPSPTTGGVPNSSSDLTYNAGTNTYTIAAGVVIEIASSSFHLNSNLIVNGTLLVTGKLTMSSGKTIQVNSGGLVSCCGSTYCSSCPSCGNSDQIDIGGVHAWSGAGGAGANSSGPFSGPITLSSGGLPITLEYFAASAHTNHIALNWTTASEINFDYFSLQRSGDGKSFNEIAQVKGNGTTNEAHNYSYEDLNPIIGRSYYRLASNDFDGYQETFKVIAVEYHGEKKFTVSPNPSDGSSVKLNFNFENDNDAQVIIYDNLGSAIGTYRVSGASAITFDNQLKGGVYLAKYSSASFTKTERFIVK